MQTVIATFAHPEHARDFAETLRRGRAGQVSRTRVGASRDDSEGHRLVVAYVKDAAVLDVRQLAVESGGVCRARVPVDTVTV